MSMADFLLNTAASGGNGALTLTIIGMGAAADTVIAKKDAGYDDTRAFILGAAAGLIEAATEKIGFDALGGALSGGVMSGVGSAAGAVNLNRTGAQLDGKNNATPESGTAGLPRASMEYFTNIEKILQTWPYLSLSE